MTLHPQSLSPIPELTAQVAHAAFPKGSLYIQMRDQLGVFFKDENFASLYPQCGQLALAPWRLALITVMQYVDKLSDRQAAEAVRGRIDWKYALSLDLRDPGFDHSVLCEFRARLLDGNAEEQLLDLMLEQFKQSGLLKVKGQQRSDSTHVVAAVRAMTRIEFLGEALRYALNTLAEVAPSWLQSIALPEWYDRYGKRLEENRLPKTAEERERLAALIGFDGFHLFYQMDVCGVPAEWRQLPAIEALRQIWVQQYYPPSETIRLRTSQDSPPGALLIRSPYDMEARRSRKRSTTWTGYKVHFTETCDEEMPRLLTNVETTESTTQDQSATPLIHDSFNQKGLRPKRHIVDQGYTSAQLILTSQSKQDIDLYGPVSTGSGWQANTKGAFDLSRFKIDWTKQQVKCPKGKVSRAWKAGKDNYGNPVIHVEFRASDCTHCPARDRCTRAKQAPRSITLKPFETYQAIEKARKRQTTKSFKKQFATRAGVEGTISQAVRGVGARQCRYVGLAKTHLQHVITAAAMNIVRAVNWLEGVPLAKTRYSRFAQLAPTNTG